MSQCQTVNNIIITPIKAFTDNYIWAIRSSNSNHLALVDPGDGQVCIDYIEQHNLKLTAVLVTHHHADHIGGIPTLLEYCHGKQQAPIIYGPFNEKISTISHRLKENDQIHLAELELSLSVLELPGHTLDHIAYYTNDLLFCGDTLFSGGCGRLFEGTPAQMLSSLNKLKSLPEKTRVYCTHEYTQANLEFALAVEPSNLELIDYYNKVVELRKTDSVTLPSSIHLEKKINPFLRCEQLSVQESANEYLGQTLAKDVDTFASIRKWKDNF